MKIPAITIVLLCTSCLQNNGDNKALNTPVSGLQQTVKNNNTAITVQYIPAYYNLALAKKNKEGGDTSFYKNNLYFKIIINKQGFTPDLKTTEYINFSMQQDFYMHSENLTRYPVICQKIENGKPGLLEYILVFAAGEDAEKKLNDFTIVYNDKVFGTGEQQFKFSALAIKKEVSVKVNQG